MREGVDGPGPEIDPDSREEDVLDEGVEVGWRGGVRERESVEGVSGGKSLGPWVE